MAMYVNLGRENEYVGKRVMCIDVQGRRRTEDRRGMDSDCGTQDRLEATGQQN